MAYFPMFIDINDKICLVVGGGKVALRKVQVLLDFDARVVVVAREIIQELTDMAPDDCKNDNKADKPKPLTLHKRPFEDSDLEGAFLVVVATNDNALNQRISDLCRRQRIPVNVVDDKEKCSYIFPSYVKEQNLVGAFSSGGNSPVLTRYLNENTRRFLTPELGKLNEFMGQLRPRVKDTVETEANRKALYKRVLDFFLQSKRVPDEGDIETIISDWR